MAAVPIMYGIHDVSHGPRMPRWKRCADICGCLVAFPVLVAATVVVAAFIRLRSPGPVFFAQDRIGHNGRRFRLYKFRTMHSDAGVSTHQSHFTRLMQSNIPMKKLDAGGDTRLIPGGWLLRATGLDELPQIVNVLRGDMSLVGPRPCIPYEYENYSAAHCARLNCVPGLTGLWQVSGKNRTTFEEMIRLDIEYGRRQSPWLDLKIILLTPGALLKQLTEIRHGRRRAPANSVPSTGAEHPSPSTP
jgi:exopolysaccharide production protein ExoY